MPNATVVLPDLYADWPLERFINPYHQSASAASAEWVESYHVLDDAAQVAFNRCKFGVLASLAYPRAEPTHLRLACDLMNWFFVFDELSDVQDGASARELGEALIDIFRNPGINRPSGHSVLGDMTQSFWNRVLAYASPSWVQRFVDSICPYIEAVFKEAQEREQKHVRNIEGYLALRRHGAGARPSLDFLLSTDLPAEVNAHPCIEGLFLGAIDLILLVNDIYSYNFERSRGLDANNIIAVVSREKALDTQEAIDYVGDMYRGVARKFLQDMSDLPSFSNESVDADVADFVFGMGNWITALLHWSFESERYFGASGQKIKSTRVMELLSQPDE